MLVIGRRDGTLRRQLGDTDRSDGPGGARFHVRLFRVAVEDLGARHVHAHAPDGLGGGGQVVSAHDDLAAVVADMRARLHAVDHELPACAILRRKLGEHVD